MLRWWSILTVPCCTFLLFSKVWGQNEAQPAIEYNPFGSVLASSKKPESETPSPPTAPAHSTDTSRSIQTEQKKEEIKTSLPELIISRNLTKKKKGINPQMLSASDLISEGKNTLLLPQEPIASEQVAQKILSQFRVKKSIAGTEWFSRNQAALQQNMVLESRTVEREVKKMESVQTLTGKMANGPDKEREKSSRATPAGSVSEETEDNLAEASQKSNEYKLVLNGIVVGTEGRFAVIRHEERWHIVSEGDLIVGKRIIKIGKKEVILQDGSQQISLSFENP